MVAIPLLHGRLVAEDYEDDIASDPRVDALRSKMVVKENEQFTRDYYDPDKRYIGNAIQVFFKDGTSTEKVSIDYPIGHRNRRDEGIPVLVDKFKSAIAGIFDADQAGKIEKACENQAGLEGMDVTDFMELWIKS